MPQQPPGMPGAEELARMRHEMVNALLVTAEQIAPLLDAADGMKADLERRGWSPTASEQVALTWLLGVMSGSIGGRSS